MRNKATEHIKAFSGIYICMYEKAGKRWALERGGNLVMDSGAGRRRKVIDTSSRASPLNGSVD